MTIKIQAPRIRSAETPREIIAEDFQSLGGELPISGGWGYAKEDAVIIDKDDTVASKNSPFDGVNIERIFVEKRLYEELIIFRPDGSQYSGIEWKLLKQRLTNYKSRTYDVLSYEVTAIPDSDWNTLKAEWESNDGFRTSESELKAHLEKRNNKTIRYTTEYWFDITSFYIGNNISIHDLYAEYVEFYQNLATNHKEIPRSISGVDENGQQFIFFTGGFRLDNVERENFIKVILEEENSIAYAYGSLTVVYNEQDDSFNEELIVVCAIKERYIQGNFSVIRRDDGSIILTSRGVLEGDDPDAYPMISYLSNPPSLSETDKLKYIQMWKSSRDDAMHRQR